MQKIDINACAPNESSFPYPMQSDTTATVATAATAPAPVFISKETTLRLLRDVREMMTCAETGIYYKHSETDMLRGYALIMGPPDSLYHGGYYFYKFKFLSK